MDAVTGASWTGQQRRLADPDHLGGSVAWFNSAAVACIRQHQGMFQPTVNSPQKKAAPTAEVMVGMVRVSMSG